MTNRVQVLSGATALIALAATLAVHSLNTEMPASVNTESLAAATAPYEGRVWILDQTTDTESDVVVHDANDSYRLTFDPLTKLATISTLAVGDVVHSDLLTYESDGTLLRLRQTNGDLLFEGTWAVSAQGGEEFLHWNRTAPTPTAPSQEAGPTVQVLGPNAVLIEEHVWGSREFRDVVDFRFVTQ